MGSMYLKKQSYFNQTILQTSVSGSSPSAKLSPCLPESEQYSLCLLL